MIAFEQAFMQHALMAGFLASVACGLVGPYVVYRRISYLAGGVAHAVLGGMGIAYFLGVRPLAGALAMAILVALAIGWVSLRDPQQEDTIISAIWAIGMALGVLFISRTPGYNVDLLSYLFGNILIIRPEDLLLMAGLCSAIALLVACFRKPFLAIAFDPEFTETRGIPRAFFHYLMLVMVSLTVVILIQLVGLILVIALLTLPTAIAGQYVRSLPPIMALGTLQGIVYTVLGLAIAYETDLPAGATIIVVVGSAYLLSTLTRSLLPGRRD